MGKVLDIQDYNTNRALKRGRVLWRNRFPETLTSDTFLADLSNQTMLTVGQFEDETATIIYSLVTGVLDLGPAIEFRSLPGPKKMKMLDVSLYLIDQVRWECMNRLGWVDNYAAQIHPMVNLILDYERIKSEFKPHIPDLQPAHPLCEEFNRRRSTDGELILRGLIPSAIKAFAQSL